MVCKIQNRVRIDFFGLVQFYKPNGQKKTNPNDLVWLFFEFTVGMPCPNKYHKRSLRLHISPPKLYPALVDIQIQHQIITRPLSAYTCNV